jgi:uncharacterized protein (DUF1800 family)
VSLAGATLELKAAIAVTRFGLGALPGEIQAAVADPGQWLEDQIAPTGSERAAPGGALTVQRMAALTRYQAEQVEIQKSGQDAEATAERLRTLRRELQAVTATDFLERFKLDALTAQGFRRRWSLFWSNHLTVSAVKLSTSLLCGPYEQEAIQPHVFGRFDHLLASAIQHPAMLLYLDQAGSVGPNSAAAVRLRNRPRGARDAGLNENLAREVLELHTVGVDGGYGQSDVTELARCLTGWTVGDEARPETAGQFVFRANTHEPGVRTIMGRRYAEGGLDQGLRVLHDLATHPATVRRLCLKLARHFVSETPPPDLVGRLVQAWQRSEGDLSELARTLIRTPAAWRPEPQKLKTPYEWLVSSYRAVNRSPKTYGQIAPTLTALGQRPFYPPSPEGWPDEAAYWAAPDGLIKRISWAERFSASVSAQMDPSAVARASLGLRLSPLTERTLARAETRKESLALLLMSPEFQRR